MFQLKWHNWIILQKPSSRERNVENWPHALLIERRAQIAPTNVIDFGSTPANGQIGMRSNRVTQSKGAVVMSRNP